MATSGKGGFRNNGQPRVQLLPGLTRVAQLKDVLRVIQRDYHKGEVYINELCQAGLDGTHKPKHLTRENCESCVGMGQIREEGETPKQDRWRRCGDCGGTGEAK